MFNIGDANREKFSIGRVIEEVKKCDVRCANCHRRKTFKENQDSKAIRTNDEIQLPPLPLFDD